MTHRDRAAPGREAEEAARICVLDYGMGNLRSVEKALELVGAAPRVTPDPHRARDAEGLVLPGVGAFPKAMRRIHELGQDELVREWAAAGRPLLGICLGMQLLFESSAEHAGGEARQGGDGAPTAGLGLLQGAVTALSAPGLKVPHIGWEPVRWQRPSPLLDGLGEDASFYFVHSFAARPADERDVLGTAAWGERFAAVVERDRVCGVQFHPEKSSTAGLRLLANFVGICAPVAAA